jgi:hypothetical protein
MKKVIPNSEKWFSLIPLDGEIWKPVVGFEELYEISTEGRVKRLAHETIDNLGRHFFREDKILKYYVSKGTGYPNVNLSKDGVHKTINVHTLIADAFIPNPDNLPCVNHIDEDRGNSVLSNLERCSYLYNNTYGDAKKKRRDTYLERNSTIPICQYSRKGELIHQYNGGLREVDRKFKKKEFKLIRQCLIKQKKTAIGYVWRYKDDEFDHTDNAYYRIPVCKYDLDGNLLMVYKNGLEEIKLTTNFDIDNIRGCLKGKSKTSQGYVWLKEGETFTYKKPEVKIKAPKGTKEDHLRPVIQISLKGDCIKSFNSIKEAALSLGNKSYCSDIVKCCKGKIRYSHGYIWKYKTE